MSSSSQRGRGRGRPLGAKDSRPRKRRHPVGKDPLAGRIKKVSKQPKKAKAKVAEAEVAEAAVNRPANALRSARLAEQQEQAHAEAAVSDNDISRLEELEEEEQLAVEGLLQLEAAAPCARAGPTIAAGGAYGDAEAAAESGSEDNVSAIVPARGRRRADQDEGIRKLSLSLTVTKLNDDLPTAAYEKLAAVFKRTKAVERFGLSYEVGGHHDRGHAQGVLEVKASSAQMVNKWVHDILSDVEGLNIKCVSLSFEKLHTFNGMLGYICKDAGLPHFRLRLKAVTADDIADGILLYGMYGDAGLKKRVEINGNNWLERAVHFCYAQLDSTVQGRFSLAATLTGMLRTGRYYAAGSWALVRFNGGSTLDRSKAEAVWNIIMDPAATQKADVERVFFSRPEFKPRYFNDDDPYDCPDELDKLLAKKNPLQAVMPYLESAGADAGAVFGGESALPYMTVPGLEDLNMTEEELMDDWNKDTIKLPDGESIGRKAAFGAVAQSTVAHAGWNPVRAGIDFNAFEQQRTAAGIIPL